MVHEHTRAARARGDMTQREAQDARHKIALKVESSYHSGYVKPLSLKGARFLCVCLSYLGGWRSPIGEVMDTVGHTGDEEEHSSFEERFDHPGKTWASVTHRQFSLQAVAVATANATYSWVESEARRVLREVLGVREKERRQEVTPPVACARRARVEVSDDDDDDDDDYDDYNRVGVGAAA